MKLEEWTVGEDREKRIQKMENRERIIGSRYNEQYKMVR